MINEIWVVLKRRLNVLTGAKSYFQIALHGRSIRV